MIRKAFIDFMVFIGTALGKYDNTDKEPEMTKERMEELNNLAMVQHLHGQCLANAALSLGNALCNQQSQMEAKRRALSQELNRQLLVRQMKNAK